VFENKVYLKKYLSESCITVVEQPSPERWGKHVYHLEAKLALLKWHRTKFYSFDGSGISSIVFMDNIYGGWIGWISSIVDFDVRYTCHIPSGKQT
jgi:hypothetical protein